MEESDGKMVINDATRIEATIPTLDHLVNQGAKIILAAHLGRPKGAREPSLSLRPVAEKLADLIARPVAFVDDCIGEKATQTAEALQPGDILLLENVRYYAEEEANDADFATKTCRETPKPTSTTPLEPLTEPHASTDGVAQSHLRSRRPLSRWPINGEGT